MTPEQMQNLRDRAHLGTITREDMLEALAEIVRQTTVIEILDSELARSKCVPRLSDSYWQDYLRR